MIGDDLPPACQPLLAVAVETQIDANLGEKDNSIMREILYRLFFKLGVSSYQKSFIGFFF